MKTYAQWLNETIKDLSYLHFIEEPWRVDFINEAGEEDCMNAFSRLGRLKIGFLDRETLEVPEIREKLDKAQKIVRIRRAGVAGNGSSPLPEKYKHAFRFDIVQNLKETEVAVLFDKEDTILGYFSPKDCLDFVDTYDIPISHLSFRRRFETITYTIDDDGFFRLESRKRHPDTQKKTKKGA